MSQPRPNDGARGPRDAGRPDDPGVSLRRRVLSLPTLLSFVVAVAFVLSIPVAWWLGNEWLHDFAYRVEMGVDLFVVSGALSFLVAGLTVGHQAMRAALTNPVETLRTE